MKQENAATSFMPPSYMMSLIILSFKNQHWWSSLEWHMQHVKSHEQRENGVNSNNFYAHEKNGSLEAMRDDIGNKKKIKSQGPRVFPPSSSSPLPQHGCTKSYCCIFKYPFDFLRFQGRVSYISGWTQTHDGAKIVVEFWVLWSPSLPVSISWGLESWRLCPHAQCIYYYFLKIPFSYLKTTHWGQRDGLALKSKHSSYRKHKTGSPYSGWWVHNCL